MSEVPPQPPAKPTSTAAATSNSTKPQTTTATTTSGASGKASDAPEPLTEVVPKTGLVFSEKSTMVELLCKPKLMPIKSEALIRLETLEKEATVALNAAAAASRAGGTAAGGFNTVVGAASDGRLGSTKQRM